MAQFVSSRNGKNNIHNRILYSPHAKRIIYYSTYAVWTLKVHNLQYLRTMDFIVPCSMESTVSTQYKISYFYAAETIRYLRFVDLYALCSIFLFVYSIYSTVYTQYILHFLFIYSIRPTIWILQFLCSFPPQRFRTVLAIFNGQYVLYLYYFFSIEKYNSFYFVYKIHIMCIF